MSEPGPGRSHPPLFAVAAFWAFVLGGAFFGVVFAANWHALGARPSVRPNGAPSIVTVGAGPVSVTVPVGIKPGPVVLPPPLVSIPVRPAEITTNIASAVVKTVLPDWQGTD